MANQIPDCRDSRIIKHVVFSLNYKIYLLKYSHLNLNIPHFLADFLFCRILTRRCEKSLNMGGLIIRTTLFAVIYLSITTLHLNKFSQVGRKLENITQPCKYRMNTIIISLIL